MLIAILITAYIAFITAFCKLAIVIASRSFRAC